MGRLHKLSRLSAQDWTILVQAWALLFILDIALRLLPFRSVLALCDRPRCRQPPAGELPPPIERCVWLSELAGRYHPVRSTCLKQALALSILLKRRGMATTLRIGVSRETGDFTAHAWLEADERIIFGLQEGRTYAPLLPRPDGRLT